MTTLLREQAASGAVRGVLVTSAKDVFIVGADITGFPAKFRKTAEQITADAWVSNQFAFGFEDLPVPSVVAINGYALGGGLEVTLTASHRVMSTTALVGVPEVKLGLFPGLGGTVRLARVAGPQAAIDWVAGGQPAKAAVALAAGVVDAVAAPAALRDTALALLKRAVAGEVDWRAAQQRKRDPVAGPAAEVQADFEAALAKLRAANGPRHQPAAEIAVEAMRQGALLERTAATRIENEAFGRVFKTQAAASLSQAFLNDQALKKLFKAHAKAARPIRQVAVLGAGIMGGGIAYTTALRGTPVRLKDIAPKQLDLGTSEAAKLLARQVKGGRLTQDKADAVLRAIQPQADDAGFGQVDLVIEAIVEKLAVKHTVLAALEQTVRPDTVIASNTSSLRIDDIAQPLARPENFVGMHFFNPVPVMPLVEVIRGSRTSDAAVATAVAHGLAMGKTPIVVKDCPGFLVNRILTPYVNGFVQLVADGADYEQIDRVMEAFGWPMGPAYLQDVVGMDTGAPVGDVIAAGYPDRMRPIERNVVKAMVAAGRYGQKNGPQAFSDQTIIERCMLPMIVEAARALEEGVVTTPAELDMALLMGVGFPAYLGGPLKYADWLGLPAVVALCDQYAALGPACQATARMREMAAQDRRYYDA
ncbi:MAG: fatty acid oxidation complex subunit alpha FadB [Burkholderiales bacterium PBB5]|nr:MAG: fatty acid oxidation complex subunit alpha FadB [Burkholderiales bacterium PBB5]